MSSLYLFKQKNPTFIDVNHWCNLKTKSKVIAGCVIDELQFGISRLLIFLGMNFTICECVPPRTLAQSIYLTTFTKIFGRVKYFMLIPRWVWLSPSLSDCLTAESWECWANGNTQPLTTRGMFDQSSSGVCWLLQRINITTRGSREL